MFESLEYLYIFIFTFLWFYASFYVFLEIFQVPHNQGSLSKASHSWEDISLLESSLSCGCLVSESCRRFCDPKDCRFQALLSVEFSRQEYWSGLPFPNPGHLPGPGIKPVCTALAGRILWRTHQGSPVSIKLVIKAAADAFLDSSWKHILIFEKEIWQISWWWCLKIVFFLHSWTTG